MSTPIQDLVNDINACMDVGSVPYVLGPPGVGKSRMVESISHRRGGVFACLVGSICDPTDLCGFPVVVQGDEIDAAGQKHPSLKFAPREAFIRLNRYGGTLFLDELTCCPPAVQAAMLTAICDWRFGDYQLDRSKVAIVAAGNPAWIAANGQELTEPMQNRLCHLEYPSGNQAVYEWCSEFPGYWGNPPKVGFNGSYISPENLVRARSSVAGFVRKSPKAWLDGRYDKDEATTKDRRKSGTNDHTSAAWPSPRSWERVANHLALCLEKKQSPWSAANRVQSEIGVGVGTEFMTHLKEVSLPDPEALLADPDNYRPSGRLDVDFATTMSVVAAIEANLTGPRYLGAWKICRAAVADKGESGPAYEAGMAAAIKLSDYLKNRNDQCKKLYESMDTKAYHQLIIESSKICKPFGNLLKKAAGELGV